MTSLAQYAAAQARTMELLHEASQLTSSELFGLGFDAKEVKRLTTLAAVYFGPTKSTRKQREAREHATVHAHSMNTLEIIESFVARLTDGTKAWALRVQLSRFTGHHKQLRRYARSLIDDYNGPDSAQETKRSMRVTSHAGTQDSSISVRGPSADIRAMESVIRAHAEANGLEPAEAAVEAMLAGGGGANYTAKVLVPLDDHVRILNGEGDDVLLGTTSGAVMTGTQYLQRVVRERCEFVLISPMHGPISIGTGRLPDTGQPIVSRDMLDSAVAKKAKDKALARHGTHKDRCLLEAAQTVCAGEDCCVPADRCEINHNLPYSRGGLSVMGNLSLLCHYHNGAAGNRQAYRNIRGEPHRIRPSGLVRNEHPIAKYGGVRALFGC